MNLRLLQICLAATSITGCCICSGAWSSELNLQGLKSNQVSKRDAGSAAILEGATRVHRIFVTDRTSSWTKREKSISGDRVAESYGFIESHARQYGVKTSLDDDVSADVYWAAGIPTEAFADPDWTEQVIRAASHGTGNELVARLRRKYEVDNVAICLHVNKAALSYNLAHYKDVDAKYLAERMICFTRYPDGRPTAAATYVHEMLHLFGAGDLYFPYDRSSERKELARRLFPDDVMRRVDYDLSRLTIGRFTAFRVGWLNRLDHAYRVFED